jgi:hypothetical protein
VWIKDSNDKDKRFKLAKSRFIPPTIELSDIIWKSRALAKRDIVVLNSQGKLLYRRLITQGNFIQTQETLGNHRILVLKHRENRQT